MCGNLKGALALPFMHTHNSHTHSAELQPLSSSAPLHTGCVVGCIDSCKIQVLATHKTSVWWYSHWPPFDDKYLRGLEPAWFNFFSTCRA
eukprot:scaffold66484_cov18-Tisochrysis_lutea.AAC.2